MEIKFKKTDPKYGCFSNFYLCNVNFNGLPFSSSEAAYQAQKSASESERKSFCGLSPDDAKEKGRRVFLRKDWETVKYKLMVQICQAKFTQNKDLRDVLLSTGDDIIIEDTTGWHDNIWGKCDCPRCVNKYGQNLLGKALMEVRENLRNAE